MSARASHHLPTYNKIITSKIKNNIVNFIPNIFRGDKFISIKIDYMGFTYYYKQFKPKCHNNNSKRTTVLSNCVSHYLQKYKISGIKN